MWTPAPRPYVPDIVENKFQHRDLLWPLLLSWVDSMFGNSLPIKNQIENEYSFPKKCNDKSLITKRSLRPIRGHRTQKLLHWRRNVNIMAMPRSLTTKQSSRICTQGSIGIWMPPMMSHQTILQHKPTILQSTPIIARVSQHSMLDCVHASICASRQNKNFM